MPPPQPTPDAPRATPHGAPKPPPGLDGADRDGEPPSWGDGERAAHSDGDAAAHGDEEAAAHGDGEAVSSGDLGSGDLASADVASGDLRSGDVASGDLGSSALDGRSSSAPRTGPTSSKPPRDVDTHHPPSMRPSVPTPPPSASRRPSRPLLASEALMEDLAPVEPLGQQARVLCIVTGALFALLGGLQLLGIQPAGRAALIPSLVVGAVTLFAAVARVSYRKRAVAMIALGAIVAGMGVAGTGPARGIATGGALWSIARAVAAAALPAALLFRARYRAFEGARLLLGLAYLTALPFAFHAIAILVDASSFGFTELGAVLSLVILAGGLPGFMGSETTAAGSFVAPLMIAAFGLQAGLQRLGALVPGSFSEVFGVVETASDEAGEIVQAAPAVLLSAGAIWDAIVTAVALAGSAFLSAVGLFQVLAWKFAPVARLIDVRRPQDSDPDERPSVEDWSTRS